MYRGLIYIGRRGIALHAISGIDIALWDIEGKAAGKPVCELIGTPQRDKVRAYASMLMPDDPARRARARRQAPRRRLHRGQARLGPARRRTPTHDVALAAAAVEAGGDGVTILIDAGHGYVADAEAGDRGRARARGARRLLARGAVPARRVRGVRRARRHGRHPRRRRRAGHDAAGASAS